MNSSLVSIIVPIYNVEPYLEQCINSICNQTYKNLQIILVNDGSTDGSTEIIKAWEEKDPRIEVIHKRNGGLVSARKAGIKRAEGLYSIYIDGDDWIENDYVEKAVSATCGLTADAVCVGHIVDDGKALRTVYNSIKAGIYLIDEILPIMLSKDEFYNFGITQYVWSKMFKTQLVQKNQMKIPDEIQIGEDVALTYTCFLHAEKVSIIEYAGYHYVQRNNSMCNVFQTDEDGKCQMLLDYLRKSFEADARKDLLLSQLRQYAKLLFLSRAIEVYDKEDSEKILVPFGGIEKNCNVVLYGAGAIGKSVKRYIDRQKDVHVIAWLDREDKSYTGADVKVQHPDEFDYEAEQVNYYIICVSNLRTMQIIRTYLEQRVQEKHKIITLSDAFMR